MRKPLLMGNWKMYKTVAEARQFAEALGQKTQSLHEHVDYAICAPATSLHILRVMLPAQVQLGAQNIHYEPQGAYTGEISGAMVAEFGTKFVLVGHSERRQYFAETNEWTKKKVRAVVQNGMTPVLCVGENLVEREAGQTLAIVEAQVKAGLGDLQAAEAAQAVIAYEPVWAIGTGKTASADDAEQVCAAIRSVVVSMFDASVAALVRILYGGSVKPDNIAAFLAQPNIDGALVGGASLEAASFAQMAEAVREVRS